MLSYLQQIFQKKNSGLPFDEYAAKGFLLAILGQMFSKMKFVENPTDQEAIKRILHFCVEHYTELMSLEMMSKELYLNKHYISNVFKDRFVSSKYWHFIFTKC